MHSNSESELRVARWEGVDGLGEKDLEIGNYEIVTGNMVITTYGPGGD